MLATVRRLSRYGLMLVLVLAFVWPGPPPQDVQTGTFAGLSEASWDVYNSIGHDGHGLRRPSQVTTADGVLTISGTTNGTTGGLQWRHHSQRYGQWDITMRATIGCGCYHPVVLLWGSDGGSGVNNPLGEIDIVEAWQRQLRDRNAFTVHYGDGSRMVGTDIAVDMTAWHTYHVVWQDTYLYTWIDDDPAYYVTRDVGVLPPGPVDLAMQLDWFPQEAATMTGTATMQVNAVTQHMKPVRY